MESDHEKLLAPSASYGTVGQQNGAPLAGGNAQQQQPVASAPPLAQMDSLPGYSNAQFGDFAYPPPPYQDSVAAPPQANTSQPIVPAVSEEEAREAFLQYVSGHCCYGKRAAREMVFNNISPSSAIHYKLQTFTESRKTSWAYEPYRGDPVDGPANGLAPQPWDVLINPSKIFHDASQTLQVPHTASVKGCHDCSGSCSKQCWECHGRGNLMCTNCGGSGHHFVQNEHHDHHHGHHDNHHHGHHHHGHHGGNGHQEQCHHCHGTGRINCWRCSSSGMVPCETCDARGSLKCYIKLVVTWKNNVADHIVGRTALPGHLITGVSGKTVFEDEQPLVAPLQTFSEQEVNTASQQLVQRHSSQFTGQRILRQHHSVRMVPVSEASYSYNSKDYTFWVYGEEDRVYEEDYPLKCGYCCTVL